MFFVCFWHHLKFGCTKWWFLFYSSIIECIQWPTGDRIITPFIPSNQTIPIHLPYIFVKTRTMLLLILSSYRIGNLCQKWAINTNDIQWAKLLKTLHFLKNNTRSWPPISIKNLWYDRSHANGPCILSVNVHFNFMSGLKWWTQSISIQVGYSEQLIVICS